MACVLPGAPRLTVDCFCWQRLGGYGSRRLLDGLPAPPPPHTGSSDGDVAIELLSEVVMW